MWSAYRLLSVTVFFDFCDARRALLTSFSETTVTRGCDLHKDKLQVRSLRFQQQSVVYFEVSLVLVLALRVKDL